MNSSSSWAPVVRRSVAICAPATTPVMASGMQPLSSGAPAARDSVAAIRRMASIFFMFPRSPEVSAFFAEQVGVDRIAQTVYRQQVHFLDARGHRMRHAEVDI